MPTFKYTRVETTGPNGAIYNIRLASKSASESGETEDGSGTVEYKKLLSESDGTNYIWIADANDMVDQPDEINLTEIGADEYPDGLFETFRDAAIAEIDEALNDLIESNINSDVYFTSSLGFKVNGDIRSYINISGLYAAADDDGTTSFRDLDNESHDLTKDQLKTLIDELAQNMANLQAQAWEKESAIEDADTFDALFSVSTEFEMTDFSA